MKRMFGLAAVILFLLTGVGQISARVRSGGQAPLFVLRDTSGRVHRLTGYLGKVIVLEWFNPDCPFVKKHYNSGNMQALQKRYRAKGVVWLSVVSSAPGKQGHYSRSAWPAVLRKRGSRATAVLLDPSGKVGRRYGARTTPDMFIINRQGKLVYTGAIDSIRSTRTADVKRARPYVRQALDALLAGRAVQVSDTRPYGCSVKYAR